MYVLDNKCMGSQMGWVISGICGCNIYFAILRNAKHYFPLQYAVICDLLSHMGLLHSSFGQPDTSSSDGG